MPYCSGRLHSAASTRRASTDRSSAVAGIWPRAVLARRPRVGWYGRGLLRRKLPRQTSRGLMRVEAGRVIDVCGRYSDQAALDAFWQESRR
jgi:hypothetical protein